MSTEFDTINIYLSSKYAVSYNYNLYSDCNFSFPLIEVPSEHYLYLTLAHCNIPYSFYNIETNNNKLYYSVNGGNLQLLKITRGNYNIKQLITFLNSNLQNFTVTYDIITNRLTFVNSLYNFYFDKSSTCLDLLGFYTDSNLYNTSILKELTSPKSVDLASHKCLHITIDIPTGSINLSNKSEMSILSSIPINTSPNSLITFVNSNNDKVCLYKNTLNAINIRITDQDNNNINLNGCHWSMSLKVDVLKFIE